MTNEDVFPEVQWNRWKTCTHLYRSQQYTDGEWKYSGTTESVYCVWRRKIYEKSPQNPVITGDMLPTECSRIDFRDPKVWKKGGKLLSDCGK